MTRIAACLAMALAIGAAAAEMKVLRLAHQSIGGDAIDPAQLNSILMAHVIDN